jgi:hypothetical protein
MAAAAATQSIMPHNLLGKAIKHVRKHDEDVQHRDLQFIAHYGDNGTVPSPSQVAQSPKKKGLAWSSKGLTIDDFELIKTVGTGAAPLAKWG